MKKIQHFLIGKLDSIHDVGYVYSIGNLNSDVVEKNNLLLNCVDVNCKLSNHVKSVKIPTFNKANGGKNVWKIRKNQKRKWKSYSDKIG